MKDVIFDRIKIIFGIILLFGFTNTASAGFMDKVTSAAQKIQQATDKVNSKTQPVTTKSSGTTSGSGNAVKPAKEAIPAVQQKAKSEPPMNEKQKCLAGIHGLYWKILADNMEKKMNFLKLTAQERKAWEADIAFLRDAWEKRLNELPPSGLKDPRWYDARFTSDERMAMSLELSSTKSKATNACLRMKNDDKYIDGEIVSGGQVSKSKSSTNANRNVQPQTADGSQKKGIYVKKTNALSCALGACDNLDGLNEMTNCQDEIGGYRWRVLAEKLEAKLSAAKGMSGQERSDWEADIAAVREAEQKRLAKVKSPDPGNEFRYLDRLSRDEQSAVNQDYLKLYNARMKYCNENVSTMSDHN